MSDFDMEELNETGEQIRKVIEQLAELDEEDLKEFKSYISRQQAQMPILEPQRWRDSGSMQLDAAERRVGALLSALDELEEDDLLIANITREHPELGDAYNPEV